MAACQSDNATELLKADHRKVNELFKQHATTRDQAMKQQLAHTIFGELTLHAQLEEQVFYPAIAAATDEAGKHLVENFRQDHQMMKDMMAELQELQGEEFDTRFRELMETVQNHVLEEETDLFPTAEAMLTTDIEALLLGMQTLKQRLLS